ncbi:hypothetical protein [Brevibacterium litoralis]|uniref:hypothetical protein n=1 Tax=Brevibacterium litoralis TaxID=3138935 RepID=UPI0032EB7E59
MSFFNRPLFRRRHDNDLAPTGFLDRIRHEVSRQWFEALEDAKTHEMEREMEKDLAGTTVHFEPHSKAYLAFLRKRRRHMDRNCDMTLRFGTGRPHGPDFEEYGFVFATPEGDFTAVNIDIEDLRAVPHPDDTRRDVELDEHALAWVRGKARVGLGEESGRNLVLETHTYKQTAERRESEGKRP